MELLKVYNLISTNNTESAVDDMKLLFSEIEICKDYNVIAYATYLKGKIEVNLGNQSFA